MTYLTPPQRAAQGQPPQGWVIRETIVHEVVVAPYEPSLPQKKRRRWLWRFILIYAVVWFSVLICIGYVFH